MGSHVVLSIREQRARLAACPTFKAQIKDGALVAIGTIQPTERSVTYTVRIEYHAGDAPEVTVLSPQLVPREEGGRLPHVYPGNKLCLYTPFFREWTPDMSLAHAIVPWIAEWLSFYELWHATGEWFGGGTQPVETRTIRNDEGTGL